MKSKILLVLYGIALLFVGFLSNSALQSFETTDEGPKIIMLEEYEVGNLPETDRILLIERKTNKVEYILSDTISIAVFAVVAKKVKEDYDKTTN